MWKCTTMKSESFLNFGKASTVDDGRSRGIHRDPRGIHTSMLTPDQNLCSDRPWRSVFEYDSTFLGFKRI